MDNKPVPSGQPLPPVHVGSLPADGWGRGGMDPETTIVPLDLRSILRILKQHYRLILVSAVMATGASAYLAHNEPIFYRASAVIRLADARRAMTGGLVASQTQALTGRPVDPLLSMVEVLTSRRVAGAVVDSAPVLRIEARNLPAGLITGVAIDSTVMRDSIIVAFTPKAVLARSWAGTVEAAYGGPISLGGVRFTIRAAPKTKRTVIQVQSRESAISRLRGRLKVAPRPNTDVADVSFAATDPNLAQAVVNRVVEIFQATNAESAQLQSRLRREFVEQQLQGNEARLIQAQRALSAFRSNAQLYSSRERLTAEQATIAEMSVRRQELQTDLQHYRSLLAALQQEDASTETLGTLISAPNVASNPVISQTYNRFVALKTARDSLTAGPWGSAETNPDVQRVDSLIRRTHDNLLASVRSLIASVEARIRGVDQLKAENATAFRSISGNEAEEARLVEQVEALRTLSAQLRAEYQKARMEEAVEVGQVEIIDRASSPERWVGVGPLRKSVFGGMIGLAIGCVLAVLLEQLDTSIRRREQVARVLQVPELAIIPQLELPSRRQLRKARANGRNKLVAAGKLAEGLIAARDVASSGAEAYRLLRTNLLFSTAERPPRTVMVTSPAPGEGKTTVASNLAVTFAQQGMNVFLVDCDLRRGRLHGVFGCPRGPGLTEVLRGELPPQRALVATSVERLWLLPMGAAPHNPAELLGSSAMRELLVLLSGEHHVTVLDVPPVLAAADASVIAAMADVTVLVVRAGQTNEDEARQALQQLVAVGARIAGAVLNDQDATVERYGDYHYTKYYGPVEAPS